jgi:hypothetical protein
MDRLRVALILVSIAIIVGPIAGTVLIYRDNLLGLVFPKEIGSPSNPSNSSILSPVSSYEPPQYINSTFDNVSRTFSITFNFTNPYPLALTVKSMSCNVECTAHHFGLGTASLASPVHMGSGQTVDVTMVGNWTEGAINHFQTDHAGAKTADVDLVGMTVDAGGVNLQLSNRQTVPNVPIP